jgi:putative transposase
MAESIIGLFKDRGDPRPRMALAIAVEIATLEWVDWYNNRRLFEALGDIPPAEAESAYYATMTPSESPRMAEQTLH